MNDKIGRCGAGGGSAHLNSLQRVRGWCEEQGVLFKVFVIIVWSGSSCLVRLQLDWTLSNGSHNIIAFVQLTVVSKLNFE